jgi:hypothetical protein
MTRSADDTSALTGRRRIAFAAYVDAERLPGLPVLLRSLALTNPGVCEDFVVLHPGLPEAAFDPARRLHPRLVTRRADGRRAIFAVDDYDTVVALDTGMVVLGDLTPLLAMRHGVGAVPQLLPGEQRHGKERRVVLDDGLFVIQRADLGPDLAARLAPTADATVPERSLDGLLDGVLVPLDSRYDFLAWRLYDDMPVPDDVVVLRLRDEAGRPGHRTADAARARFDLPDDRFHADYCALPGGKHPDLLLHCALPLLADAPDVDLARAVAEVHRTRGRYQEGADLLARAVGTQVDRPRCHETLGALLCALSRYDEAETHFLLAAAAPDVAPQAYGQLARLAWLRGDDAVAHAYAREGLDADPTDANCRALHRRTRPRDADPAGDETAARQLAHVALFSEGRENAGDKILPEAVRRCFGPDTGPRRWLPIHVHRVFDDAALEQVNARRGIVVGGGGLFLPDTAPNGSSAWQWNVSDAALERITVPLAVFAVGYNVFDGQVYRRERFARSLTALVRRSAFFGLRNHGSVDRVRELLPADLADRVRFQPCPTTVARHLVPDWTDAAERDETVLLNCAYDRAGLRFGHDYGHFLAEMATAVRALGAHAEVRYAAHMTSDERFVHDLRREHGITMPVEPLYDAGNDRILDVYRRTRLVIGMRGHAGMIPFGCGTPILSLVSHPKLQYFLTDIDRPDWGVSVHDRHLAARLTERAGHILRHHAAAVLDVRDRQQDLWRTTRDNIAELDRVFG